MNDHTAALQRFLDAALERDRARGGDSLVGKLALGLPMRATKVRAGVRQILRHLWAGEAWTEQLLTAIESEYRSRVMKRSNSERTNTCWQ